MKKNYFFTFVLIILILITTITLYLFVFNDNNSADDGLIYFGNNGYRTNLLGINSIGNVSKLGPFGNVSSNYKVAYVIGVHPQENMTHKTLLKTLNNTDNLKYSYYVYSVNVSKDIEDYDKGRLNGQLLAQKYVVPDVLNEKFNLLLDIHSNAGNWDENQYIFSPVKGRTSEKIAIEIKNKSSFLAYYTSPFSTSTDYLTIPIDNGGIPSVIYEEYNKNSQELMDSHFRELISIVDNLKF